MWDKLGKIFKFFKYLIVFKYDVEVVLSRIIDILILVGRIGKIIYIVNILLVLLN